MSSPSRYVDDTIAKSAAAAMKPEMAHRCRDRLSFAHHCAKYLYGSNRVGSRIWNLLASATPRIRH
jgi:hypothetical protein